MGDPDLGIWTLSSLVATVGVPLTDWLALLLGLPEVLSLDVPDLCDQPPLWLHPLPTVLGVGLVGWRLAGTRPQGRTLGVTIPFLSPLLASQGSPEPRLRPHPALSFWGAALCSLFLDVPVFRAPRPWDQLVRGSGSFKLLILFSCKLLMPWFKHLFFKR